MSQSLYHGALVIHACSTGSERQAPILQKAIKFYLAALDYAFAKCTVASCARYPPGQKVPGEALVIGPK